MKTYSIKKLQKKMKERGFIIHPKCLEWTYDQWLTALTGEVGELANEFKKINRGKKTLEEAKPEIAKEMADIFSYLLMLCNYFDVDLHDTTVDKFNEVSDRFGSDFKL